MKIKQTVRSMVLGGFFVFATLGVAAAPVATANAATCGGVETALLQCGGKEDANKIENTGLWRLLLLAINILTAGVGVVALAGIVYGAVLYTSAGGNPEQVKKARGIITNVVIGVVAFAGMFTLLNFLIPGGVFN